MNPYKKAIIALCIVLLTTGTGLARFGTTKSSFRCGTNLVSTGDHKLVVLSKCGDPVYKDIIGYRLSRNGSREYKIEEWAYGPDNGYFTILTFEGGDLVKIEDFKN